jgi:hypothetical protein
VAAITCDAFGFAWMIYVNLAEESDKVPCMRRAYTLDDYVERATQ